MFHPRIPSISSFSFSLLWLKSRDFSPSALSSLYVCAALSERPVRVFTPSYFSLPAGKWWWPSQTASKAIKPTAGSKDEDKSRRISITRLTINTVQKQSTDMDDLHLHLGSTLSPVQS
ncbi:hypothetical protein RRG08_005982 [Elysia crispata]|uniref:Uncharacterized protein n=1 Tax=Elysia crispata TaxID=231223 RepID=A0AAE0YP93_9GAST|nr:hypothetical protein RRG08_005982 [Elysia crispata]